MARVSITIEVRFARWVEPYAQLMGRLGVGGPRYTQAVIDFVRERGVQRVLR